MDESEANQLCADCQIRPPTRVNVLIGTFVCEPCATEHLKNFPVLNYIKLLDEVFDTH